MKNIVNLPELMQSNSYRHNKRQHCDSLAYECFSWYALRSLKWRCCEKSPCEIEVSVMSPHAVQSSPNRKAGAVQKAQIIWRHPLPCLSVTSSSSVWIKEEMHHTSSVNPKEWLSGRLSPAIPLRLREIFGCWKVVAVLCSAEKNKLVKEEVGKASVMA